MITGKVEGRRSSGRSPIEHRCPWLSRIGGVLFIREIGVGNRMLSNEAMTKEVLSEVPKTAVWGIQLGYYERSREGKEKGRRRAGKVPGYPFLVIRRN